MSDELQEGNGTPVLAEVSLGEPEYSEEAKAFIGKLRWIEPMCCGAGSNG